MDVIRLQLQADRTGKGFEASRTEARDLGTRPSSGTNSQ